MVECSTAVVISMIDIAGVVSKVSPELLLFKVNNGFHGDFKTGEGFLGSIDSSTWKAVEVPEACFFLVNNLPIFFLSPPRKTEGSQ